MTNSTSRHPAKVMPPTLPPELVLPPELSAEALKDVHPAVPILLDAFVKLSAVWRAQALVVAQLTAERSLLHDENSALVAQIVGHSDQSKH